MNERFRGREKDGEGCAGLGNRPLNACSMYSDGNHTAISFDLNEYIETGCFHIEKGVSFRKKGVARKKRAWPEKFSGGFAPGPPINPVTKLPGSAPDIRCENGETHMSEIFNWSDVEYPQSSAEIALLRSVLLRSSRIWPHGNYQCGTFKRLFSSAASLKLLSYFGSSFRSL